MAKYLALVFLCLTPLLAPSARAQNFSTTEFQVQYGNLTVPNFAGGGEDSTIILTGQTASDYSWGDIFAFVDVSNGEDGETNHFNDWDVYTEIYVNLSSAKLLKVNYGDGALRDIGVIAGMNYDADAGSLKFLPGVRLAWNAPGFVFLNTDFMGYFDASEGVDEGAFKAPAETDSWMVDVNFAGKQFELGGQYFNIEGHVEYVEGRENEFGGEVVSHLLGQPQFRWDAGHAFFGERNKLFLGVEYQFWFNKLGESGTDEHALQALGVWRF